MNCSLPAGVCRTLNFSLAALRDLLLLALRLYVAWVFFKSGLTKIEDWNSTVALFEYEYTVPLLPPAIAAMLGTAGELLLPPLLALGLATRFAALGLTVVNAVAVISYPALWGFECPAAIQSHFFWGAGLLFLLANGGGRVAVDTFLWRNKVCAVQND